MKKILILILIFSAPAFADTVKVPRKCDQVIDTKFSTGNGESAFYYLSITCKDKENQFVVYNVVKLTAAGWLGMGRIYIPNTIEIEKADVNQPSWD